MEQPTVIAALITAGGALVGKTLEWVGRRDDKAQADAQTVVTKVYDTLRLNFTDGCVQVLKLLESGENQATFQIRGRLYPNLNLDNAIERQFDGEFKYRLEYLRLNGVVTLVGGSEYGITRLGQAFLEEARKRRDYFKVLFGA
jgi:hypothetical protein